MELQFKETSVQAFQDLTRMNKSVQLAMESVVPDTRDDIGRILSVRPEIFLKSKELRNKTVAISGEAQVTVLYINEDETAVSFFSMSQNFAQEWECPSALDSDSLQLRLLIGGIQARILNPRKVSADVEIIADFTVSRSINMIVSQELPETNRPPVHVKRSEANAVLTTAICEKSFSINEQLPFPDTEQKPGVLIGKELHYLIKEREVVGNRLLLKGEVLMHVLYMLSESSLPCRCRLSIPFSQLIDLGTEQAEIAEVWIVPSSDYLSLIDSLDGSRLLDIDLHALAQVRTMRNQKLQLITDVYSNQMPCECSFSEQPSCESIRQLPVRLRSEERIDLPEEYQDLLFSCATLGPCTVEQGSAAADLLCRSKDGKLFVMRRTVSLRPEEDHGNAAVNAFRLTDFQISPVDGQLNLSVCAEAAGLIREMNTIRRAETLSLDDQQRYDSASYPSLTAVWAQTESIWELAKQYHSSPEAICEMNPDPDRRPIFIPKAK